jgi:O-antigen/teichoic acid export membrane protein
MRRRIRSGLDTFHGDLLLKRLFHGSAVSMLVRVAGMVLALLSHLILSRAMGASEYGSYVIALGWAMVLVIPARLGLDNNVLRFATIYREEHRIGALHGLIRFSLAAIALASMLIAGGLLLARAVGVGPLRDVNVMLLLGVASIILPLAVLGWLSALIRTAHRILASQFYEQVLRPFLLIVGLGVVLVAGRSLDAAGAMLLTGGTVAIALAGIAVHARKTFGPMRAVQRSFEDRRLWLSVSGVLFVMAIARELLNQIDLILLGILANTVEAAHFAVAWRLASLVQFGLVAIVLVSAPLIASAYQRKDLAELARIARLTARISILFALVMAIVLAVAGEWALGLFGPGFDQAYPALLILLAGGLVSAFTGSVGYYLILTGHQRAALYILVVALMVSVALNTLLIPPLGAIGSAIASAVALSLLNLGMLIYVRRKLGIDASALGRSPTG